MLINWIRCATYEEARDYSRVIYLHEWNDAPFYWGKADGSFFGGHKRTHDGLHASGRYNSGYRHWIEGCLRHGAKLYIGLLDEEGKKRINEIEQYHICTYGHVMNTRVFAVAPAIVVQHSGSVPASIQNHAAQQIFLADRRNDAAPYER